MFILLARSGQQFCQIYLFFLKTLLVSQDVKRLKSNRLLSSLTYSNRNGELVYSYVPRVSRTGSLG